MDDLFHTLVSTGHGTHTRARPDGDAPLLEGAAFGATFDAVLAAEMAVGEAEIIVPPDKATPDGPLTLPTSDIDVESPPVALPDPTGEEDVAVSVGHMSATNIAINAQFADAGSSTIGQRKALPLGDTAPLTLPPNTVDDARIVGEMVTPSVEDTPIQNVTRMLDVAGPVILPQGPAKEATSLPLTIPIPDDIPEQPITTAPAAAGTGPIGQLDPNSDAAPARILDQTASVVGLMADHKSTLAQPNTIPPADRAEGPSLPNTIPTAKDAAHDLRPNTIPPAKGAESQVLPLTIPVGPNVTVTVRSVANVGTSVVGTTPALTRTDTPTSDVTLTQTPVAMPQRLEVGTSIPPTQAQVDQAASLTPQPTARPEVLVLGGQPRGTTPPLVPQASAVALGQTPVALGASSQTTLPIGTPTVAPVPSSPAITIPLLRQQASAPATTPAQIANAPQAAPIASEQAPIAMGALSQITSPTGPQPVAPTPANPANTMPLLGQQASTSAIAATQTADTPRTAQATRTGGWTIAPATTPASFVATPMASTLQMVAPQFAAAVDSIGKALPDLEFTLQAASASLTTTALTPSSSIMGQAPSVTAQVIAQQIAGALSNRTTDTDAPLELALDPPELGRVRMQISEVAGVMTLMIQAERPETADLMRRHLELLAQEFAEAGLGAPSVHISQDGSNDGGQASLGERADQPNTQAAELDTIPLPQPTSRTATGGLDLRL